MSLIASTRLFGASSHQLWSRLLVRGFAMSSNSSPRTERASYDKTSVSGPVWQPGSQPFCMRSCSTAYVSSSGKIRQNLAEKPTKIKKPKKKNVLGVPLQINSKDYGYFSAILTIIENSSCFTDNDKARAMKIRRAVRNRWAHPNLDNYTDQYVHQMFENSFEFVHILPEDIFKDTTRKMQQLKQNGYKYIKTQETPKGYENKAFDKIQGHPIPIYTLNLLWDTMKKRGPPPSYYLAKEEGPSHDRTFTMVCKFGELEETGEGKTKKLASRQAAYKMLDRVNIAMDDKENSNLYGKDLQLFEKTSVVSSQS